MMGTKQDSELSLGDHRVRLNYEHLEDRYIKPVTILVPEDEKIRLWFKGWWPIISYSRLTRRRYAKTSKR